MIDEATAEQLRVARRDLDVVVAEGERRRGDYSRDRIAPAQTRLRETIEQALAAGSSQKEIAEFYGVSKQRVWQWLRVDGA